MEVGASAFNKLVKRVVKPISMDIVRIPFHISKAKEDLGLKEEDRAMLQGDLDYIINCAASVDFNQRIDQAVMLNVRGPLMLLKLAQQCPKLKGFC